MKHVNDYLKLLSWSTDFKAMWRQTEIIQLKNEKNVYYVYVCKCIIDKFSWFLAFILTANI